MLVFVGEHYISIAGGFWQKMENQIEQEPWRRSLDVLERLKKLYDANENSNQQINFSDSKGFPE